MTTYTSILTKRLTKEVLRKYFLLMILFFFFLIVTICPVLSLNENIKNEENTNFIATQYEQTLNSIESQMSSLVSNSEISRLLKEYKQPTPQSSALIEQELQQYISSFRQVHYCMIESPNGTLFSSFSNGASPASLLCQQDPYYQELKESKYYNYYSRIYTPGDFASDEYISDFGNTVFSAKSINEDGSRYIFTLFYNVDNLIANCESIQVRTFNSYFIMNRRKDTIYSSLDQRINPYSENILNTINSQSGQILTINGIYYYRNISYFGWTIITYMSWFEFFSSLYPIIGILLLCFLLIPLFFYKLIVSLNNQYLEPLSVLTNQISQYSAGQNIKTNIKTGDEIEILSYSIDKMIEKINAQIEDIKQQERQNCVTQYSLLATQIDPHFIYNTLNIINILARQNGQDDILAINTALSKILRERFSVKATIFDNLENEIDTIKQYCTIMKYRYQNHIYVDINAESSLLYHKIPKNLLLPIVENSFYHGLSNEDGIFQGNIDISIYSIKDKIIIEISDNGKGIPPEKLQYFKENQFKSPDVDRTHIGLSNVYQRLGFIYKDCFSFDISSSLGHGTTCSITIPFKDDEL
ncbi:MAG TPA: histidine kinase [Clostridiales bacterium]|nr:histidine kinase [Clostridiales bacterium]